MRVAAYGYPTGPGGAAVVDAQEMPCVPAPTVELMPLSLALFGVTSTLGGPVGRDLNNRFPWHPASAGPKSGPAARRGVRVAKDGVIWHNGQVLDLRGPSLRASILSF